jgi:hypothetical protein
MDTFGKLLIGGVVVFAGYELFFAPKASASSSNPMVKTDRWTVKSGAGVSPPGPFGVGDVVVVTLHDGKTNRDVPFPLIVMGNMSDPSGSKGLDCVYNPSALTGMLPPTIPVPPLLDGLTSGTHFAVFPSDISVHVPKGADFKPPPSDSLVSHVMSETDIDLTPLGFAMLAGYGDSTNPADQVVQAFVADNPSLKIVTASPMPGHPEIYPVTTFAKPPGSDIDSPTTSYFAVQPWTAGMTVKVRKNPGDIFPSDKLPTISPAAIPIPTGLVHGDAYVGQTMADEALPHGVKPFGGGGFGKGAIAVPRGS